MILRGTTLFILVIVVVRMNTGVDSDEKGEGQDEFYMFPDIEDGNAINATMELLDSQRIYQRNISEIFQVMLRKNKKNEDFPDLEHSIDGIIEFADELITNSTKLIEVMMKNGSASDDDFRREPLRYQTTRELLDCWKFIDDFIDDYIQMYDFNVDEEVEAMKIPVENAIQEVEFYILYLDTVYRKTGKWRDEIYFRYPKYGRPYLQGAPTTVSSPRINISGYFYHQHLYDNENASEIFSY